MSSLPQTKAIRLDRKGSRLYVTLDDPATRNAMTEQLTSDLSAVLAATAEDRTLRTMIIQGSNGAFCAGANLKGARVSLGEPPPAGAPDPLFLSNRRGGELFARVNSHPLTVIAIVTGPAFGGGFGLACCADVVISTPQSRFALSETSLGLPPAQIAPYVAARLGLKTARRLALTGARFDGKYALEIGLADFYCATEQELEATMTKLLNDIGRCAPGANAVTKRLLLATVGRRPEELLDAAAEAFAACLRGPEGREGVAAFNEKRPASWVETV
jgi:isohexenylglutaconyl-CoA hydratase